MRCEDVSIELSARAHDEGPPDDDPAILEAHLGECPECASLERDLDAVRATWRTARETEILPAPDAWTRLVSRLQTEPRTRRIPAPLLAIPAVAAAAAVLLFALLVQPAVDDGLVLEPRYGDLRIDQDDLEAGRTARLASGSTVRNVGHAAARVDLPHGSLILAPGTSVRRIEASRFELVDGAALVQTERPLRLDVGDARIDVLGTEFAVTRTGDGVTTHVIDGRVRLTGPGGRVLLSRGTRSFCARGGEPSPPVATSPWRTLAWLGEPRLRFRALPPSVDGAIELEILVETDSREEIPIRPFTQATGDFLLEILDPAGRRFPLKILPAMILERSQPPGHRAAYPLVRGRPYGIRLRLRPSDLGEAPGIYSVSASYNVRAPAGESLWQGRLLSEPSLIER